MWKEIKRLAKYLLGNDEPRIPLDELPEPRPRPPPEALRRYLPKPSRVNSLYLGWEFRKSMPLPPSHLYGRFNQPAQKPSWSFAVPQRMPFSTEELFLRVLAQATRRAKSDRTLRDDYWGSLKKRSQRALVDELLQSQNLHLQRDFPELEWTIAGLETKTDPWALIAAHARSRAREKKTRNAITAFEVILKTQWRITRGYGPPMPFPGGIWGPTPVAPSGLGPGTGLPPGGGRGAPPDGYSPQGTRSPFRGPPFPPGGGAEGGQGVPITLTTDDGRCGGPQPMPPIPVHSQTQPRESTQSKHRPKMVLREPKWVIVKEGGKKTKKSKDKKQKSRRKDAGEHNKRHMNKPRVYVELRESGRYYRPAAAGPSGGGHRPSSPPGPGISHPPPLTPPLGSPGLSPPPRPASDFVPADGGRWRAHIPPAPPVARPPPPQPTHIHMPSAQTQREEEQEEEEAEEVFEEILEEFSELTDTKGKRKNRRRPSEWNGQVPEQQLSPDTAESMADERRRMQGEDRHRQDAELDVSISRSLMRQVERASCRRLTAEGSELHDRSVRLERMAERQAPPPPTFVVPGPMERARLAREREPRVLHVVQPPRTPYVEVERSRDLEDRERESREREVMERAEKEPGERRRREDMEQEVRERVKKEQEERRRRGDMEREVREPVEREFEESEQAGRRMEERRWEER